MPLCESRIVFSRTKINGQLHKLKFEAFHPDDVSSQGNWVYGHPWL